MAVSIIGPKFYAWDSDTGKPLAFGKVYTYQAGTNTPKATFTTEGGETQNANPVILNGAFNQIDNAFSDQQEIIASYKYNESMTSEQKEEAIESYYQQKNRALEKFYRQAKDALEQVHDEMP